jgi:hypothetical protein
MVHSDVGVRCKTCAPVQARPLSERLPLLGGGVGSILAIILVVALIGTGGSLLAGGGADDISDFYDDDYLQEFQNGDVTVLEVVDPWVPEEAADAPAEGRRFVAVEVLVEVDASEELPHYVYSYDYQLKDTEDFVYAPVGYGETRAEPPLPDVDLEPGEKTQGWVTFEVDEDSDLVSLTTGTKVIDLQ